MTEQLVALTRPVSASIADCELTHLDRSPIDLDLACAQHTAYEALLAALGCEVRHLPAADDMPDAVFVEDIAVVTPELAVLTRPGAASRRPEIPSVRDALAPFRTLAALTAPAILDGGDVLQVGSRLFVGLSSRTNQAGIDALAALLGPQSITVTPVRTPRCLHLKSAVSQVSPDTLLINPDWVDPTPFADFNLIEIDPSEPCAANALLIGSSLIVDAAYPLTAARLESHGLDLQPISLSELAKAEGGLTCSSLIFRRHAERTVIHRDPNSMDG